MERIPVLFMICFINRVVYNVYANEGSLSTKKVYNSWEALRLVYESGKEICPENIPANHLLLMRCIKTVLLLESHISKGSFITNCKNILKYYIRENYNGQFNEGKYNMIIQNLLLSKRFKLLYHIMRLRTILHVWLLDKMIRWFQWKKRWHYLIYAHRFWYSWLR